MEKSDGIITKSSNEILSELFGAFNVEPPKINDKEKDSDSEVEDTDLGKKSKKGKRKKTKKKSKKHKKKRSHTDSDRESECSLSKSKKKKKKNKERKIKKNSQSSPNSLNIELPVNQVPMALEIMLDGTVGIKGEDGVITEIPDVEKNSKELNSSTDLVPNGDIESSLSNENENNKCDDNDKSDEKKSYATKVPEIFEAELIDQNENKKKGKIQIRDLKFSTVFQETVKAVEEKQKKELERKANIEEGELSDSTESEPHMDHDDKDEGNKNEEKSATPDRKFSNHSKIYYKNENIRIYLRKRKRSSSSSRSRSRSRSKHRSRSRSRHRSHSKHRSHDKSSHKRRRSRSRHRNRHHSSHRSGDGYRKRSPSPKKFHHSRFRDGHRSRSRSRRSRDRKDRTQSSHRSKSREIKERCKTKSKERSESVEKIDKEKLLAIARKNALKLIDAGVVSGAEKLATIKAGGKTVNELTEYCKKLSKKEALGNDVSDVESESSDEGEKPFHHPFQIRDRPNSIIMNIKNSIPLPVKSLQEKAAEQSKLLRLQFPVSSGSSHRRTENEWVPVSPKKEEVSEKQAIIQQTIMPTEMSFATSMPAENIPVYSQSQVPIPSMMEFAALPPSEQYNNPMFPMMQPNAMSSKLDISSIVSKRLEAIRKLQDNPNDSQALTQMYSAQQEMQYWAESKQNFGAFTGSTGVKILSASELSSGAQAWAKRISDALPCPAQCGAFVYPASYSLTHYDFLRDNEAGIPENLLQGVVVGVDYVTTALTQLQPDVSAILSSPKKSPDQLTAATPVKGGMGMALLQKMGWQPGEGLGKNKEGSLEPLRLEVKMDKKGLLASDEFRKGGKKIPLIHQGSVLPNVKGLDGKHPVSLLNEFCSRRRYGVPQFELCFECGPDHKKNFLFKVRVNGIEYTPSVASPNKKQAKAEAAAICLRALGVISSTT